jgi:hypothetical protein
LEKVNIICSNLWFVVRENNEITEEGRVTKKEKCNGKTRRI